MRGDTLWQSSVRVFWDADMKGMGDPSLALPLQGELFPRGPSCRLGLWGGGCMMGLPKHICAALPQVSLCCRGRCVAPGMGGGYWSLCGVSRTWSNLSSYFSRTSAFQGHA